MVAAKDDVREYVLPIVAVLYLCVCLSWVFYDYYKKKGSAAFARALVSTVCAVVLMALSVFAVAH